MRLAFSRAMRLPARAPARVTSHTVGRGGESIVLVARGRLSCSLVGYLAGDFPRSRDCARAS